MDRVDLLIMKLKTYMLSRMYQMAINIMLDHMDDEAQPEAKPERDAKSKARVRRQTDADDDAREGDQDEDSAGDREKPTRKRPASRNQTPKRAPKQKAEDPAYERDTDNRMVKRLFRCLSPTLDPAEISYVMHHGPKDAKCELITDLIQDTDVFNVNRSRERVTYDVLGIPMTFPNAIRALKSYLNKQNADA